MANPKKIVEGVKEETSGVENPTLAENSVSEVSNQNVEGTESQSAATAETVEGTESQGLAQAVTGENVEEMVKKILQKPAHIEDAFTHNPDAKLLFETADGVVFLTYSDALNHVRFLDTKDIKTFAR